MNRLIVLAALLGAGIVLATASAASSAGGKPSQ